MNRFKTLFGGAGIIIGGLSLIFTFQNCSNSTDFAVDVSSGVSPFSVNQNPPFVGGNSEVVIRVNDYPGDTVIDNSDTVIDFEVLAPNSTLTDVQCTLNGAVIDCESSDTIVLTGEELGVGAQVFTIRGETSDGDSAQTDIEWVIYNEIVARSREIVVSEINDKVDILIVVDNSGSMEQEQEHLAQRVETFMERFAQLDYLIAVTSTDWDGDLDFDSGRAVRLTDGSYCITPAMDLAKAQQELGRAITSVGLEGTGNERGIFTSYQFYERASVPGSNESTCVRQDAAKHIIVISDEDESLFKQKQGGVISDEPLPEQEKSRGEVLAQLVGDHFPGSTLKFHSIVASPFTPEGVACQETGDALRLARRYASFSMDTAGVVGNLCANDYGSQLQEMGQSVSDSQKVYGLDCVAVASGSTAGRVTRNGQPISIGWRFAANTIEFDQNLPRGTYQVQYFCFQ